MKETTEEELQQEDRHPSPEQVGEDAYQLAGGRYLAVLGGGLMMFANIEGTRVDVKLSPGELLQIADLVSENRGRIEEEFARIEPQALAGSPVFIATGEGPEPIPTNQNVHKDPPSGSAS